MAIVRKTIRTVKVRTQVRQERTVTVVREAAGREMAVTLPDVPAISPELHGTTYRVGRLLTDGADNPKLAKSNASETNYRTWGLTLAPANMSGYQVCGSRSAGCTQACLDHQGQARVFESINIARVAKTIAFFTQREAFLTMLRRELAAIVRLADRKGFAPAVRLNVLSDLPWEKLAPWIFTDFSTIQFYDYTKHAARMRRWCEGKLPANYHLTFSRSEANEDDCLEVLALGGTVAVVFASKDLPDTWHGHPVVNGDANDLRFLDPAGHVVGLYAKGDAKYDPSGFVVPGRLALRVIG